MCKREEELLKERGVASLSWTREINFLEPIFRRDRLLLFLNVDRIMNGKLY